MEALSSVTRLPGTLQRLGLDFARIALLFVLGHEQALREEGFFGDGMDARTVKRFFEQWQDQPAAKDITSQPMLVVGETSMLKSTILGSKFVVETPNNETSFGIAESLLSTLEAFLSTSIESDVTPIHERISIVLIPSAQSKGTPQISFPDDDNSRVEVMHPANLDLKTAAERLDFLKWLEECLLQISCRMLMIKDADAWLEQVARS